MIFSAKSVIWRTRACNCVADASAGGFDGVAAEIDRTVIDLLGHRVGEFRLLGKIDLAVDDVHRQPGYAELLLAGRIKLRQFRDRRYLAQQAQPIELPLIGGAGRPRQLGRPADLAFDLLDELPDLDGCRLRLLSLNANERSFVLLIRKPASSGH